jgi:hypothetical protein
MFFKGGQVYIFSISGHSGKDPGVRWQDELTIPSALAQGIEIRDAGARQDPDLWHSVWIVICMINLSQAFPQDHFP